MRALMMAFGLAGLWFAGKAALQGPPQIALVLLPVLVCGLLSIWCFFYRRSRVLSNHGSLSLIGPGLLLTAAIVEGLLLIPGLPSLFPPGGLVWGFGWAGAGIMLIVAIASEDTPAN